MDFASIPLAYQLNCPSCGALVKFASKASVYAVCGSCRSMLVRHDMNLEDLGKVSLLQNDPSPFQIGTEGFYEGKTFTLIGRINVGWQDGFWNEWHMFFSPDKSGWLAEAQGFYMVSFRIDSSGQIPDQKNMTVGQEVLLGKKPYKVDDIKRAKCLFAEGELPFKVVLNWEYLNVDLTGPNQEFASISYSDEGPETYVGKYLPMEELKLKNLRKFDGW